MLINFLYGVPTLLLCLMLQAFLLVAVRWFYRRHQNEVDSEAWWPTLQVIWWVMALLLLGNLGQIGIWATLFVALGEFTDFDAAFYHSAVNFATLGYGDFVMSDKHKLLGPLEAINGVLMIGVSTALLMTALQDALSRTLSARNK